MEEPVFAAAIRKGRGYEGAVYIGPSIEEIRSKVDKIGGPPYDVRKINLPWYAVLERIFTHQDINELSRDRARQNIQYYFKGGEKAVSLFFYFVHERPLPFKESELEKAIVEVSSQNA